MEQTIIQDRRRIGLSQTASGKLTWDITVELFNKSNEETVKEAMDLKKILIQNIEVKQ